jgi:uncharacterized protein YndB with AHSA1/START domain
MLEKILVSAEPASRTLVITRDFDAPPNVVFAAWTTPEHVRHRWDPSGAPLAVCEIDLRPGGSFRWVNQGGHNQGDQNPGEKRREYPFTGTYREIAPPDRLVFAARTFPGSPESLATLSFIEEDGGKTKFTLTIECQSIEDRDTLLAMRVDVGTARALENLAAFLPTVAQMEARK